MQEQDKMAGGVFSDVPKPNPAADSLMFPDNRTKLTKELRVSLDVQLQEMKRLLQFAHGREECNALGNAETRLKETIMWLGMTLKALGNENPYPNSYKPENTIIDKTADGLKL